MAENDPQGVPFPRPSFAVVLNYEQVRKLQAKLINKGYDFQAALLAAQKVLARMKAEHESEFQRLLQGGQENGPGKEGWGKRGQKRKHSDGGKGNPKGKGS